MSTVPVRRSGPGAAVDIARLLERQLPHSPEAEAALLGSMILDSRVIGDVIQVITDAGDFYKPAHAAIYQVLVEAYDRNEPVDLVQLSQRLRDRGLLEEVGGVPYLVELAESVPSPANAVYYAKEVRQKAQLRRLIDAAGRILQDAFTSADPADQILDRAEKEIFQVAESRLSQEATDLGTLVQELYDQLAARHGQGPMLTGLETGFHDLDELTSGLQKGEMIVIAGRPSMGKTALALSMAEHIAIVRKQPAAIFSLEMSRQQLAQRLLCSRSGVDSHRVRRNMIREEEFHSLVMAVSELAESRLFIDDTPGITLLALRAKARRLVVQHDVRVIFIDYLQLMSSPGAESRQQEVSELSRGIKALARELNIPVVCLSQLNRSPENREGHRPRMSDLRESGSIEQDADVIMLLHREEYYHDEEWKRENPDKVGVAEVIVAKQRNGPVGTVELQFNPSLAKFNNLARRTTVMGDVPI